MNGDGGDFCLIPVAVAAKAGSARQDWIFGDGGKEIQNWDRDQEFSDCSIQTKWGHCFMRNRDDYYVEDNDDDDPIAAVLLRWGGTAINKLHGWIPMSEQVSFP